MLHSQPAAGLTARIEQLLADRQGHADALSRVDETLAAVANALGAASSNGQASAEAEPSVAVPEKKRRGRPPGVRNAMRAPVPPTRGQRTRGSYAVTGDELILAFIKQHKNPTTSEIKAHWASEGRLGTADNVLSKLFREKRVKRKPLGKGIRGSRYSVA
jgi:hypothetical protein